MSETINILLLALVQGLTEFLPISSSGHLILLKNLFNKDLMLDARFITVILHFATMLSTILIFKFKIQALLQNVSYKNLIKIKNLQDIQKNPELWLILMIILGTFSTGIVVFILKDSLRSLEKEILWTGIAFLINGLILFSTFFLSNKKNKRQLSIKDAMIIGLAQGIAITPGISRSGLTITIALWLSIQRNQASEYSFLLSLPTIFLGTILEMAEQISDLDPILLGFESFVGIILGFLVSFIVGYLSLKLLLKYIHAGRLYPFAYYSWMVALMIGLFFE